MNDEVKRRREALEWSPLELAYRAGVSEQTIRNIEADRVRKPHSIRRVLKALEEGERSCAR